jgi:hypothetical protein
MKQNCKRTVKTQRLFRLCCNRVQRNHT